MYKQEKKVCNSWGYSPEGSSSQWVPRTVWSESAETDREEIWHLSLRPIATWHVHWEKSEISLYSDSLNRQALNNWLHTAQKHCLLSAFISRQDPRGLQRQLNCIRKRSHGSISKLQERMRTDSGCIPPPTRYRLKTSQNICSVKIGILLNTRNPLWTSLFPLTYRSMWSLSLYNQCVFVKDLRV